MVNLETGGVGGALDLYVPLAMRWVCVENKNNRCIKIGVSGILHVNNEELNVPADLAEKKLSTKHRLIIPFALTKG